MAGPGTGGDRTYKAEENMNTSQFAVVVCGAADGGMKLPTAAGEGRILGVLQDKPINDQFGKVRKVFLTTVVLAGSVAYGDYLEIANAAGDVRKFSAQGNSIVAQAEMAGVSGDHIDAFLVRFPGNVVHPSS